MTQEVTRRAMRYCADWRDVLRMNVRFPDVIARLGGDEFALILASCPPHRIQVVANKITRVLNPLHASWEGSTYSIGASVGLAEISERYRSDSDWLNAADQACYRAKKAGRGKLCRAGSNSLGVELKGKQS